MQFKYNRLSGLLLLMTMTASCSEIESIGEEPSNDNIINVGGVETGEMTVTTRAKADDAEKQQWLVQPLRNGLDITYGLYGVLHADSKEDVAILKLTDETTSPATYSFNYRKDGTNHTTEDEKAVWRNNGSHYFQGVHVPERIRYSTDVSEVDASGKAPGLTTDQQDDNALGTDEAALGNYTLLSHYLGMPANYRLTATVERIKLPFRHRLARVVAFVLIDPELHTKLKGYSLDAKGKDDPNTTSLRFCNVSVLQGVKDEVGTGDHHTLTPKWKKARKIVPHSEGERGSYNYKTLQLLDDNFKMYVGTSAAGKTEELYPTSNGWQAAHDDASDHKGYKEINYGKVPVYDIIVRPTYTSTENVMYDEEGYNPDSQTELKRISDGSNSIDFEIELENGLRYEKTFEFDLNANYQTVVYLRISREKVDYDDAGSEIWIEEKNYDGWYGTDNENGNTLSYAGSSWQRAYTFGAEMSENYTDANSSGGVTDGHFYNASSSAEEREKAQYFTSDYKNIWVEKFLQAYQGGKHHGDYFVLRSHISIDARLIPKDFVFTGHLDGQDKTITLTNVGVPVYKDAKNLTERLYTKSGDVYTEWNIPTLYVKLSTPVYYSDSELAEVNGVSYVKSTLVWKEEEKIYYTKDEADAENAKLEHHPLTTDENGKNPGEEGYIDTYDKEQYVHGYTPLTTESVKETIAAHYEATESSVQATTADVKCYNITYLVATETTSPAYPTTLEQLKTNEYYLDDNTGTRFSCPEKLYQFSHNSPAYLFHGLKGDYTTKQESNSSLPADQWEANVHKETNKTTVWVPTLGYRAEVLNVKVANPSKLFCPDAVITGNVQNCYNITAEGKEAVTNTPKIPQYKDD